MTRPTFAVLTTIHPPTWQTRRLAELLAGVGGRMVVIGDRKGPERYSLPSAGYLSLQEQLKLPLSLATALPLNHYARKNLGYLTAIGEGAAVIYETDDDTAPNAGWTFRTRETAAVSVPIGKGWFNVFRQFTDENIWPRGFPLRSILDPSTYAVDWSTRAVETVIAPVQQELIDISPDVDSIWRLVLNKEFRFRKGHSIHVPPGLWCPFNTQASWWWPDAFVLMYLPSHCSFRMTDIWRSLVAQRCLWELGYGVVFHAPGVDQVRNPHDLLRDFEDEVPGYLNNENLATTLENLRLAPGSSATADNIQVCYRALVAAGFFPEAELELLSGWIRDFGACVLRARDKADPA